MKFGELGIGVTGEFVKNNFDKIADWVQKDYKKRKAEITMEHGIMRIWVHDFVADSATWIENIDGDLDIDNILQSEKEKEDREKYEALRKKFEKEAV